MTDKPTPEQIQRACDLANASNPAFVYTAIDYDDLRNHSFRALADTIAQLDAMQAERDKARADLGGIYIQLDGVSGLHRLADDSRQAIEAAHDLAAPYRVETDPLKAEARELIARIKEGDGAPNLAQAHRDGVHDDSLVHVAVMAALKRGLEIGRSA